MAADKESIQDKLARIQLETAELGLEKAQEDNAKFKAEKESRSRRNRQRQAQLKLERDKAAAIQEACFHKQGGTPENPLEGDGPSCLTVAKMPDGYTEMIQCNRCGLDCRTPHPNGKKRDPKKYAADLARFNALRKEAKGNKLQPMQSVTFDFMKDDVKFVPETPTYVELNAQAV